MRFSLLILLFLPGLLLGKGTSITASGGSPIPTAFSISNTQSQIQECQGNVIEVLNQTTAVLAMGFGTVTAAPGFTFTFIPPGPASGHSIKPKGGSGAGTYVYLKSAGSSITSGTAQVSCYYEEER